MAQITKDLYQFSIKIPFGDSNFTLHQYLPLSEEPVLIATGTMEHAENILPDIKKLLNGKELKYIIFPHFESDECGGLPVFLKEYPDVVTICSNLSTRELPGFGYKGKIETKGQNDTLLGDGFSFKFINYPSEVHLQDGIVFYEENRKIFFSSDLMLRFGYGRNQVIDSSWKQEVDNINTQVIPNENRLNILKKNLSSLDPDFIAVGHGYCINCNPN